MTGGMTGGMGESSRFYLFIIQWLMTKCGGYTAHHLSPHSQELGRHSVTVGCREVNTQEVKAPVLTALTAINRFGPVAGDSLNAATPIVSL
jgi:hypothetical protein